MWQLRAKVVAASGLRHHEVLGADWIGSTEQQCDIAGLTRRCAAHRECTWCKAKKRRSISSLHAIVDGDCRQASGTGGTTRTTTTTTIPVLLTTGCAYARTAAACANSGSSAAAAAITSTNERTRKIIGIAAFTSGGVTRSCREPSASSTSSTADAYRAASAAKGAWTTRYSCACTA
ncbi:hypothetical protein [Comamonas piscis]